MSKPLSRVAVAVLIGFIVILAVFATVQAAPASSGQLRGRVDATAADPYYASQQRGVPQNLSPYSVDNKGGGHGGCESDGFNSTDY